MHAQQDYSAFMVWFNNKFRVPDEPPREVPRLPILIKEEAKVAALPLKTYDDYELKEALRSPYTKDGGPPSSRPHSSN